MEASQKARADAEAQQHMRVTLLEKRLQGAGELFEQNKLLMTERNALKAALLEEQIRNEETLGWGPLCMLWAAFCMPADRRLCSHGLTTL